MTSQEPERAVREDWNLARSKGRRSFVWKMAILWGVVFGGGFVASSIYKGRSSLTDPAFVLIAAAGGYFVGAKVWDGNEKRVRERDQTANPPAPNQDCPSGPN